METLSIKSKERLDLEAIATMLSPNWRIETSPGNAITVHGQKGRAYLHQDTQVTGHGMHCLLLDYSDVELAKQLVVIIADNPNLIVDNDFGTVLPGDKFMARCRVEGGWDWRL
jgi:hypothetical protein